jgi:hypothetical protein
LQYSEFHYVPLVSHEVNHETTETARFSTGEIVNIILVEDRAGPKEGGQHIVAVASADLKEFTVAVHQNVNTVTSVNEDQSRQNYRPMKYWNLVSAIAGLGNMKSF